MNYDFIKIEKKWQKYWEKNKTFKVIENSDKPKYYCLDMFPYPSGNGLHVGHILGYTATDIIARFKKLQGYNVLSPMGYDAFGLPAEQYAIQTGNDPKDFTYKNIENFTRQIKRSGKAIDWDRTFATCDPNYYKWTQWIFTKLYKKGLAELRDEEVNWCEQLGTVLANDEILNVDGKMVSERGGYPVVKKPMRQWVLKITKYADRLLKDLDLLEWPEKIKESQRNWIGKSVGATVKFKVKGKNNKIKVFTTRLDTIYGVNYLALAPEHPLVSKLTKNERKAEVIKYINESKAKSDIERQANKVKTGVFTGSYAINPISGEEIPIWITDYVLIHYGTGAIMAVPAHDQRDYEFSKKFNLKIVPVIEGFNGKEAYTEDGKHINSPLINGLNTEKAINKMLDYVVKNKLGEKTITYKLRDWVFSRQRYWGEPFPCYYDENNKVYLDRKLPVLLPKIKNIKPSKTGESPLANAKSWVYFTKNNKKYRRETNTMPQLAGSSWYYIAYVLKRLDKIIPINSAKAKKELDKWLPVDLYIGGSEHAVGHLLYTRFWHKFLYDLGLVSSKEPFKKLFNQGMILGENNEKMSKSRGNVVNPDDIFKSHGADALRYYQMQMGPLEGEKPWITKDLDGVTNNIKRVINLYNNEIVNENVSELDFIYNQTVKKVTQDYEKLSFNTAISQTQKFVREVNTIKKIDYEKARNFLILLNPIIPHITEEINEKILKNKQELATSKWPSWDESKLTLNKIEVVFQVNGKVRGREKIAIDLSKDEVLELAKQNENVSNFLENKNIIKVIHIPNKLINIVVR